jgi:hypothetical protein
VIKDERETLNKILLNDELPDMNDPVKSATEIAGRLRRYARMKGGSGSRLSYELVTALVERVIDIMHGRNLLGGLPKGFAIDELVSKVVITAPAAAAQRAGDVERAANWIQMITMMLGPQAALLAAKVEELAPQMGRWLGVEEKFIRSRSERKQLTDLVAQIVAQQQQAAQKPPDQQEQAAAIAAGGGAQGMPGMGMPAGMNGAMT